jgi:hypothetical protein
MKKTYTKKPVDIEAMQWLEETKCKDMFEFLGGCQDHTIKVDGKNFYMEDGELFIKTLEGNHHASIGDYIIKGVKGEFYPCKPDIFEMTYTKKES